MHDAALGARDQAPPVRQTALRLTPEQTRQLTAEVYAVLDRWSAEHREPQPGTEIVGVFTAVIPLVDHPA